MNGLFSSINKYACLAIKLMVSVTILNENEVLYLKKFQSWKSKQAIYYWPSFIMFTIFMLEIVICPFNMSCLKAKRTNLKTEIKSKPQLLREVWKVVPICSSILTIISLFLTVSSFTLRLERTLNQINRPQEDGPLFALFICLFDYWGYIGLE